MNDLEGVRCLVTGAGGFLGSAIYRALVAAGAEVHGTQRADGSRWRVAALRHTGRFHTLDLRDAAAVGRLLVEVRPSVLFHAACHPSRHYDNPLADVLANDVMATAHLLDAAARFDLARFVHLGSALEGPAASPSDVSGQPPMPGTLRGCTKAAASLLVRHAAQSQRVPGVVLRPFHVYGPWESLDRLVPTAVRAGLLGELLPLTDESDAKARGALARDFVFVDDVAEACLAAATASTVVGGSFEIGSGRGTTNREIVSQVERVIGRSINVRLGAFARRPNDVARRLADPAPARRALDWRAATDLAPGLRKAMVWMRDHMLQEKRSSRVRGPSSEIG